MRRGGKDSRGRKSQGDRPEVGKNIPESSLSLFVEVKSGWTPKILGILKTLCFAYFIFKVSIILILNLADIFNTNL